MGLVFRDKLRSRTSNPLAAISYLSRSAKPPTHEKFLK